MNKKCFISFPVFYTSRLMIRAFREADFNDYTEWHNGDILYYMMGIHDVKKGDTACFNRLFLKNVPRMFQSKESIVWCIAEKSSDRCIGKIELFQLGRIADSAEIGYCLSKSERGNGYMTEAVKEVLDWAFNHLQLNRIYAHVLVENTDSANVLLRCGFQLEGTLRECVTAEYTKTGDELKKTEEKPFKDQQIYGPLRRDFTFSNK